MTELTTAAASLIGGMHAIDSSSASSRQDEVRMSAARVHRWFPVSDETRGAYTSDVVVGQVTISSQNANWILGTRGREGWLLREYENFTILRVEDLVVSNDMVNTIGPALSAIGRLARLRAGWDSYGAPPVSIEAQRNAQRFLAILGASVPTLPAPAVGPSKSGGVVLAWRLGDLEVDVEVDDVYLEYLIARRGSNDTIAEGLVRKDSLRAAAIEIAQFLTQS